VRTSIPTTIPPNSVPDFIEEVDRLFSLWRSRNYPLADMRTAIAKFTARQVSGRWRAELRQQLTTLLHNWPTPELITLKSRKRQRSIPPSGDESVQPPAVALCVIPPAAPPSSTVVAIQPPVDVIPPSGDESRQPPAVAQCVIPSAVPSPSTVVVIQPSVSVAEPSLSQPPVSAFKKRLRDRGIDLLFPFQMGMRCRIVGFGPLGQEETICGLVTKRASLRGQMGFKTDEGLILSLPLEGWVVTEASVCI